MLSVLGGQRGKPSRESRLRKVTITQRYSWWCCRWVQRGCFILSGGNVQARCTPQHRTTLSPTSCYHISHPKQSLHAPTSNKLNCLHLLQQNGMGCCDFLRLGFSKGMILVILRFDAVDDLAGRASNQLVALGNTATHSHTSVECWCHRHP